MKLLELQIENTRGIRHLSLKPDGKNMVIWGPNGSGKSAVVDAIDFLLTGRITRLTGKGSKGLALDRHGPHIGHSPAEATVRAVVQLQGRAEPIEIRRCMATPNILEYAPQFRPLLEPVLVLAQRGQHVLTRREILKYITAEAGTRAQEIQELLRIEEVEDIRKSLVRVQNDLQKELQSASTAVSTAREAANATAQQSAFRTDAILEAVNRCRTILGGQPISELGSQNLKAGLRPFAVVSAAGTVNVAVLQRDVENLRRVTRAQGKAEIAQADDLLRAALIRIRDDPQAVRALRLQQLTNLGLELIDDSGSCPLCDRSWPPGELRQYLQQKAARAQEAEELLRSVAEWTATISSAVDRTRASFDRVIAAAQLVDLSEAASVLNLWQQSLHEFRHSLESPAETYPPAHTSSVQVSQLLAPAGVEKILDNIEASANDRYPETTPEQTAWDTLTHLEANLQALEGATDRLQHAELAWRRSSILLHAFMHARDAILGELYDAIRDRFVGLYRQLHELDESGFAARIEPAQAGLNLEVDFYGRGLHPPHALHSEGHQDSMGLCLYLSLAEHLSGGIIDLVILDDVVMSVDADHRRQICHLLAANFPGRQFVVTTHDRTWAHQLRSECVVQSRGSVEFYNWHLDTGPQVSHETDLWEQIEADLQRNDVPGAAARLRRGSESFFASVCDNLQAPVTYKLSGRWELGDYLPAALSQYGKLVRKAKAVANSWNDAEQRALFEELESTAGQIHRRTNAEQWAVNASVHYNNWANLGREDFVPVVETFQDLYSLFLCSKCGTPLRVATTGTTQVSVRCNCGKVNWNLLPKEKETVPMV